MTKEKKFSKELAEIKAMVREIMKENNPNRVDNWTHVAGGGETGSTWKRNIDAYNGLGFNMNAINAVKTEDLDLSTKLPGCKTTIPISIAPMSSAISNVCDNAFVELARGAKLAGTAASIGYPTAESICEEMLGTGADVFRIIKPLKDLSKLIEELKKVESSGCFATGVDVDSIAGLKPVGDSNHYGELARPLSLEELRQAKESVNIPFIIKGVMSVEDAVLAKNIGADGVVISTHAGYALDYCPSPLEVLPEICKYVKNDMTVIVDSGITRGSDVVKALALGADAVLIGRLALWGLTIGGGEGLQWIIKIMVEEIERIMVLLGAQKLSDLNSNSLVALNGLGEKILNG